MKYLLDTATCVDVLRGEPSVLAQLNRCTPDDCAVSTVTAYELFVGAGKCRQPKQELAKIKGLLDEVHEVVFDRKAAQHAGKIRVALETAGAPIGPYDILIAAQGRASGLTVVTSNDREFSRVAGLSVANWRE
ncbi:type II toxin-antitoxin system VapC family toxin [Planctomycetota bacterium]